MYHSDMRITERFWSKVDTTGICWEWTRGKQKGYGRFTVNGKQWKAHRFAWTELVGPVSDDLDLDHVCRNRACVNPDHLDPVTRRVNILRGSVVQRNLNVTHCPDGHPYSGENLITRGNKRYCRACHRNRYVPVPPQTHCKNGHPFDPENTGERISRGRVIRRCKTCAREATAKHRAAKKKAGG